MRFRCSRSIREHPDDFYLLRIGYGGAMGALSNIDQEGFPSAAFHSYPQNLRWDTYTGDYGPNFFGHAVTTGDLRRQSSRRIGWQAFGGNVRSASGWVTVQTLDSLRRRIYLAPLGLYLTLDAGTFESVAINPSTRAVRLTLSPSNDIHAVGAAARSSSRRRSPAPARITRRQTYPIERGALVIPLQRTATTAVLTPAVSAHTGRVS